tara:strand:+ start:80 stop:457 length:378 start_codon:yes stop_codon:yes gene_type:complete
MGEVSIAINGKNYGIACDDGQEERVRELGRYVDERLKSLGGAGGAMNETQNLVLTTILLADEIADLRNYIDQNGVDGDAAEPRVEVKEVQIPPAISDEDEAKFANTVETLANRIEDLATRLAKAA